ncbi:RNA-binding protein pno1-like [Onthophagus taurus]|uniref:RNA-binding protein pno1-like n=1 Tax=Onthophagus taurus TaxID=166361 RepID=UPI0039BEB8E6
MAQTVFDGFFCQIINPPSMMYNIGSNRRVLRRSQSLNQPYSSFYARKFPQQQMQTLLRYWKIITSTLERLNLYGTVNYESQSVKIYEKVSGNPYFPRAGDFLDAVIFGFNVEDALILLTTDDIFSEFLDLKPAYIEIALWLEISQQNQRQVKQFNGNVNNF